MLSYRFKFDRVHHQEAAQIQEEFKFPHAWKLSSLNTLI